MDRETRKAGLYLLWLYLLWQVKKPMGAKAGLVQLNGDVQTLRVDWRREQPRLARLEKDEVPLPVEE
tara:strand:+ start:117 stop:317 length:201 start_codon:yes stop_codon:yes gene_type:complete|eukprot:scaffold172_cov20-Phaeocystis_antarctica.AAC.1